MSTEESNETGPYPSFEEYRENRKGVAATDNARRIYWPLQGDFPSKMAYMKREGRNRRLNSLDDMEPLYEPETDTWHEIALQPLTTRKVSSITVGIRELNEWDGRWEAFHEECSESQKEYVTYGDLDDETRPYRMDGAEDGNWEEDSDTEFLIACCGKERPIGKGWKSIQVVPSEGQDFVTVKDYLSTVDAWLMAMRTDLLLSSEEYHWNNASENDDIMVDTGIGQNIRVITKKTWISSHGPLPPDPMREERTRKFMETIRKQKEQDRLHREKWEAEQDKLAKAQDRYTNAEY